MAPREYADGELNQLLEIRGSDFAAIARKFRETLAHRMPNQLFVGTDDEGGALGE